ncbi:hypothetical protein PR048_001419 [Dryococelus australis]|uniref:Uncharacterized protein n=1 Tax=Dryococelus australis TaxID=614101 RepID=A0ABQ9II07_9NEOP|nr:hypothetical protein PR048_001419 [Dryococelus australis]
MNCQNRRHVAVLLADTGANTRSSLLSTSLLVEEVDVEPSSPSSRPTGRGGAVARLLSFNLGQTGFSSRRGCSRNFSTGVTHQMTGFLGDLQFPPPKRLTAIPHISSDPQQKQLPSPFHKNVIVCNTPKERPQQHSGYSTSLPPLRAHAQHPYFNTHTFAQGIYLTANQFFILLFQHNTFSHMGIVLDDAVGWQVFLKNSCFPCPCILAPLHIHLVSPSSPLNTPFWVDINNTGTLGPSTYQQSALAWFINNTRRSCQAYVSKAAILDHLLAARGPPTPSGGKDWPSQSSHVVVLAAPAKIIPHSAVTHINKMNKHIGFRLTQLDRLVLKAYHYI